MVTWNFACPMTGAQQGSSFVRLKVFVLKLCQLDNINFLWSSGFLGCCTTLCCSVFLAQLVFGCPGGLGSLLCRGLSDFCLLVFSVRQCYGYVSFRECVLGVKAFHDLGHFFFGSTPCGHPFHGLVGGGHGKNSRFNRKVFGCY
jgi:hypothetical protein